MTMTATVIPEVTSDLNEYNNKTANITSNIISLYPRAVSGESTVTQSIPHSLNKRSRSRANDDEVIHHSAVSPLVGDEITRAIDYLLNRPQRYISSNTNLRDYTLFIFGINVGLRINDLLSIKIRDITRNGVVVKMFRILESKTGKKREIFLVSKVQEVLQSYIDSLGDWDEQWYLFHATWPHSVPSKSLSDRNVGFMMKDIQRGLGLDVELATHSLRKTFARGMLDSLMARGDTFAIEKVSEVLGHSSIKMTRKYIGLERVDMENIINSVGGIGC